MSEMKLEEMKNVLPADAFDSLPEDEKNNEFIAMKSKTSSKYFKKRTSS